MVSLRVSGESNDLNWPAINEIDYSADAYGRYAELYDALYFNLNTDTQFYVSQARSYVPRGEKLLELGAGTGRLTAYLLDDGHEVVGVDSSGEMLARARETFRDNDRLELHCIDVRELALEGRTFALVIGPYGLTAHLLTDADRLSAFRRIYAHLKPGGVFVYDDCPTWLVDPDDDTALHLSIIQEQAAGTKLRLMTNTIEAADAPVSVRYDFIDRLDAAGRVQTRTIVRLVLRNIELQAELLLLAQAGFTHVELLGGFDGRTFDKESFTSNSRLILRCHRDK